ncbi:chemotaxis protein CheD [Conexibacter woesei]|nr:chemotaxis protein CheD [Conexibacter woesei]
MGELAVSATPGDELTSIGLGSCIGVALVDRARGVAALAHVMLPDATADLDAPAGKYADRAIPALVAAAEELGARRVRLEAVLVGGAQMFDVGVGSALDIGARNAVAVRAALQSARIPVRAEQVGGRRGRTMRVHVDPLHVTVKEAGGREAELWNGSPTARRSAAEVTH